MQLHQKVLFSGAASELITPFNQNGDIDYPALGEEIEFILSSGIKGLYINGYQTEYLLLDRGERDEITRYIAGVVNGRVPIAGNILVDSLYEGKALAARYREIGLDAVMLFTPFTFPFSPQSTRILFSGIADETDLPAYICNAPNINKLSPKQIVALFDSNPRFIGCKDATRNILELQQLIDLSGDRHMELMAGSDSQIQVTMMLGGLGIFSLLTTLFPSMIAQTVEACEKKDWQKAALLQAKVNRIREAIKIGPFMAAYKYVARKIGHPLGYMRAPFIEISEADAIRIDAILTSEGVY